MSGFMAPRSSVMLFYWGYVLILVVLTGCQAEETFEEEPIKANLRQISKAYWTHLGYHDVPPKPENLKQDVEGLHSLGMGSPADVAMISPRDQQPIVIIYGADNKTSGDEILAYEKVGADGTRWVVTMSQNIHELSNEEFAKARFAKGHKPESN